LRRNLENLVESLLAEFVQLELFADDAVIIIEDLCEDFDELGSVEAFVQVEL
jgi:hypothetical protein